MYVWEGVGGGMRVCRGVYEGWVGGWGVEELGWDGVGMEHSYTVSLSRLGPALAVLIIGIVCPLNLFCFSLSRKRTSYMRVFDFYAAPTKLVRARS